MANWADASSACFPFGGWQENLSLSEAKGGRRGGSLEVGTYVIGRGGLAYTNRSKIGNGKEGRSVGGERKLLKDFLRACTCLVFRVQFTA